MVCIFQGWLDKVKSLLPKNKFKADYYEMLKKLKELEKQVGDQSKQLDLAKSSFLKNLYHEIRTPLNAIVGFNNLLSADFQFDVNEQKEYMRHINNSSAEFLKVMDCIIQASLLEAGMVNLKPDSCTLSSIINDTYTYCSLRRRVIQKDEIALLKNVPDDIKEIQVVCDEYYLVQVLNHLVENALKFTEKGVVEFGVSASDENVEFYVKDTGTGNLFGKEGYLFDKFTKIDVSDGAQNGMGLGLSNVKSIVELMNGKIWYDSIPGKGTCFYFSIPYKEEFSDNKRKHNSFLEGVFRGQNSLTV